MPDFLDILIQAVDSKQKSPSAQETFSALLTAEKNSHRQQQQYEFAQLLGKWQLCYITGTKNSRSQFSNLLKDGLYLPTFTPINITYSLPPHTQVNTNQGRVINTVNVGLVKFTIEGPCKFMPKKNILAFDFTYLTMFILGAKIYAQNIRGGKNSEEKFFSSNINRQAFFSYFLVNEQLIAARGRGGGLALWRNIYRE